MSHLWISQSRTNRTSHLTKSTACSLTNSPLTLLTMLCGPRFPFPICFTLSLFLFLVNCATGNMHAQFKFKHTVSVINGRKKLPFIHRVPPVGFSRYTGATGYPLLPFLGDLHAYSCGKCWDDPDIPNFTHPCISSWLTCPLKMFVIPPPSLQRCW